MVQSKHDIDNVRSMENMCATCLRVKSRLTQQGGQIMDRDSRIEQFYRQFSRSDNIYFKLDETFSLFN